MRRDIRSRETKISDIEHVFEEAHHALNGCFNQFPGSIEILRAKLKEVLHAVDALAPVCGVCNDMHRMELHDRMVPCTHCPTPCQLCREYGTGAYCAATPCSCTCHNCKKCGASRMSGLSEEMCCCDGI